MEIETYLLLVTTNISSQVLSIENFGPDDGSLLLVFCQTLTTNSAPLTLCIYCIKGSRAGAFVTNSIHVKEQNMRNLKWPTYISRSYRTRVGRRDEQVSSVRMAHACVPDVESLTQIISMLSIHPTPSINTEKMFREDIFHALKVEYPCE